MTCKMSVWKREGKAEVAEYVEGGWINGERNPHNTLDSSLPHLIRSVILGDLVHCRTSHRSMRANQTHEE